MNDAAQENTDKEQVSSKPKTLEAMIKQAGQKIDQERNKAFEKKFSEEFKKLDDAEAVARGIRRNLEKLYAEHTENV